ncbi:MAG: adenosylcobinamide-phosphate synthase CbiB [Proteobacteria bacterium]|nr:adenosylcobinamide-phosphate synthase CbiB [Pseudomonadota bacterium]
MKLQALVDANFHFIILGFLIEFFIGYPNKFPHPVVFMGKLVSLFEWLFYGNSNDPKILKRRGIIIAILLVIFVYAFFGIINILFGRGIIGWIINVFFTMTIIATGSLINECSKVIRYLRVNDIESARNQLSMLVTRDTKEMNEEEIIRTTIETLSENLCDGVIAPLFYLFLGGIPLAMAYKMLSTLDSMVGYKNEKYRYFGWASARLEDIATWIPARITAFFIIFSATILGYDWRKSIYIWERDRNKTESPNSGHPESAFAGAIGVWFGGKVKYFGIDYDKPIIGDVGTTVDIKVFDRALNLATGTAFFGLFTMSIAEVIFRIW